MIERVIAWSARNKFVVLLLTAVAVGFALAALTIGLGVRCASTPLASATSPGCRLLAGSYVTCMVGAVPLMTF